MVLALAACGMRLVAKSWRAPSTLTLGVWSVYILLPLALAPEYKVSGLAVWTVLILAGAIAIGASLGEGLATHKQTHGVAAISANRMLSASLTFTLLALAGTIHFAFVELRTYGLDFSAAGLLLLGRLVAVDRYYGTQQPFLVRLLVLWVFPAALLGGMSYFVAKTRIKRILSLAWLAPAVLYSVFNAARANTLIAVILAASGYLSMSIHRGGFRVTSRKAILIGAAFLVVTLSFFFAVEAVRANQADSELANPVDLARLKSTILGYLPVFSHWTDDAENAFGSHPAMGAYTFSGVFDAAGLRTREVGVYSEFVTLDADQSNNLYTAFRGVIEDFSLPGALAFLLLVGFFSGYAYRNCALGRLSWAPWLALFYAFLLWSPVVSVLIYNGPILAAVSSCIVLVINKSRSAVPSQV